MRSCVSSRFTDTMQSYEDSAGDQSPHGKKLCAMRCVLTCRHAVDGLDAPQGSALRVSSWLLAVGD